MTAPTGASASATPPPVATILPPFVNPSQMGRAWPSHRRCSGEHADPFTTDLESDHCRYEPLRDIEQRDGNTEPASVAAPHVGGADVAAALRSNVLAAQQPDDDHPEGDRPDQVAPGDDEGILEHR